MKNVVGTGDFVRKPSLALLDPVNLVAYSKPVRRDSAGYREDAALQAILDDQGIELARLFASRRYHGVQVAVYVGGV